MIYFIIENFLVKNMTDKIKLNKELIQNNPNKSGNELYIESKAKGLGIRKTNFLGLVREVRNLPEPSVEKREKSIPIKHRIVKPKPIEQKDITKPTKEGQYGITEIYDQDSKTSYWIKYTSKKDFDKQLDILKEKYQIENMSIIPHGFKSYTEFIDQEFERELENLGIFL